MSDFDFKPLECKGAFVIDNFHVGDNRGSFVKCFEKKIFKNAGITFHLDETFSSINAVNVVRGLHFQKNNPQAKLVTVLSGAVWDVIVDLRPESSTYKKWESVELSSNNHSGIYIPRGFAHGFVSLQDGTIMLYQCDGKYDKDTDTGIRFDDPDLAIDWPVSEKEAIHSIRDLQLQSFVEYLRNPMEKNW